MHGAGNDFIIVDNLSLALDKAALSALAAKLCSRRTGVGADGLMAVIPAADPTADYGMLFFNADGSEGEMCGNGARCIARYGHDAKLAGDAQRIETISGTVTGQRITPTLYRVRLNDPTLVELHREVHALGRTYDCAYIELGSPGLPHAVLVLDEDEARDEAHLRALGKALRYAEEFPRGANVTLITALAPRALTAVTYERGVEDFTLACGTGCGASVAALTLRGALDGSGTADIKMPGGTLSVTLTPDFAAETARDIFLTGPTAVVFTGETAEI